MAMYSINLAIKIDNQNLILRVYLGQNLDIKFRFISTASIRNRPSNIYHENIRNSHSNRIC